MSETERIRAFWDDRATLGGRSGTNDVNLVELEQAHLLAEIPRGARVLDVGCGDGRTLLRLAAERGCHGMGVDFSPAMLAAARASAEEAGLAHRVQFQQTTLPALPSDLGDFEIAYSQRSLINLTSDAAQRAAVQAIGAALRPGGRYLMLESSRQGAEASNALRRQLGLEDVEPPWHNRFFDEGEVARWGLKALQFEEIVHISSLYHLLSRVVYAGLAAATGEALRYDAPINRLAIQLPQQVGEFGPLKAWHWRRVTSD